MSEYHPESGQPSQGGWGAGQNDPYAPPSGAARSPGGASYGQEYYAQPQYGAPQQGAPQYAAPQYGQAQYGAPFGYPSYGGASAYAGAAPLAGLGARLGARIIDALIILVPAFVLLFVALIPAFRHSETTYYNGYSYTTTTGVGSVAAFLLTALIIAALAAAYEIVLIGKRGATLGKQALGIKVVNEDGSPVSMGTSATRWAVYYLPGLIPFVGGFWGLIVALSPCFDSVRKQGFHDKAAHTLVVSAR